MRRFWILALSACLSFVPLAADETRAELGEKAPDFTLNDLDGNAHSLSDYAGKVVVLEWFNPDCPFVKKHHQRAKTMKETFEAFRGKEVVWLAINSGSPGKQGHGVERNRRAVTEYGIDYPILIDEPGDVGRLYGARTTPHMYVIDVNGTLVYNGAIDNRPGRALGDVNYVEKALERVISGEAPETPSTKPYGCSVKY